MQMPKNEAREKIFFVTSQWLKVNMMLKASLQ